MHIHARNSVRLAILGVATGTALAVVPLPAAEAITSVGNFTYHVNSTTDTNATDCTAAGNTDCGIDDAIRTYNADANTNDADTIVFSSSISTFSSSGQFIDNNTSGVTLAINGNGQSATAVSGGNANEVFYIASDVTISGLTIEDGYVDGNRDLGGGGIHNAADTLTLTHVTITNNQADNDALGGGILNSGTVYLTDSTLSDNSALNGGSGGGVENLGTIYMTNDSLSGDSAGGGGGGLYNDGTAYLTDVTLSGESDSAVANTGTLYSTNDTFSGNPAGSTGAGGGLGNYGSGTAYLTYDTFSGNSAPAGAGAGIWNNGDSVTIANSILDDGPGECANLPVVDGGYNVEADHSCFNGTSDNVENSSTINLASLAANGSSGPETFAIGTDSSAFEEVPTASCAPVVDGTPITTDERGDPRPGVAGANCDAGAYELQETVTSFTTAGCSTWEVPDGVTTIYMAAYGAAGEDSFSASGGAGDEVTAALAVQPETLDVCVDQGGGDGGPGVDGSSEDGAAGGGASGVALGSDFGTPLLVAGGGGGAGGTGSGGAGGRGGDAGQAGDNGAGTNGGTGGDAAVGGPSSGGGPGAGVAGRAGDGDSSEGGGGGGGGGGGYIGGGGGQGGTPAGVGGGGGGGGGSDFCDPSNPALNNCHTNAEAGTGTGAGSDPGDARVVLTYVLQPTPSVSYPDDATTYGTNWAGSITGLANVNTSGAAVHAVAVSVQHVAGTSPCWSGSGNTYNQPCPHYVPVTAATNWSLPFPGSDLTSGETYNVTAQVTDTYGNAGTGPTHTFTYDTTAPSDSVTYPVDTTSYNASTWTGTITGTANAHASSATIDSTAVQIKDTTATTYWNGASWQASPTFTAATFSSPNWSCSLAAVNLTAGHGYAVIGRAFDDAGNVGTSTPVTFTFTTTAPANGKLAFSTNRNGNYEIYSMNANGTGQTRLTTNSTTDQSPAWSPDGTKLAFQSNRTGNFQLYTMSANGTGQTRLTTNSKTDLTPAWSPDGTKIAFASNRNGPYEIYVMNANGTGQTRLTTNTATDLAPAWSPDGSKIAFSSNRNGNYEIYVMNTNGTGQTRLTTNSATDSTPVWSPDSTKIAFSTNRDGNYEIYTMNANGTGQTRLTTNTAIDQLPAWSPDGTKIAFSTNRNSSVEIYLMNTNGTALTRLTNNTATDTMSGWQAA